CQEGSCEEDAREEGARQGDRGQEGDDVEDGCREGRRALGSSQEGSGHPSCERRQGEVVTEGRWVTFEGGDGSGKSTQAALLAEWISERGRTVVRTREPGGS